MSTPWTIACQAPLFSTISWSVLKFMSIELVMLSNHLILCHPLLLLPQSFQASGSFPVSQCFVSGGQSIVPPICLSFAKHRTNSISLSLGSCKVLSTYLRGDKKTVKLALGSPWHRGHGAITLSPTARGVMHKHNPHSHSFKTSDHS